uniref:Ion_trans_2 domain-containing protein n=1 Tax=Heterorhabditis bacteriophora TaxID=37862 RepID=A0A1I7WVC0_HETBA
MHSQPRMEISRQTIGSFFGHTEVPQISLTDMSDTSKYKYTVEPKVKRNVSSEEKAAVAAISIPQKNIYYWLCRVDDIISLQHLFMIVFLVFFSVSGALMFYIQESTNEAKLSILYVVPIRVKEINKMVMKFAKEFKDKQLTTNITHKIALFKENYKDLLNFDGVYKWSTYYKIDERKKWNPYSAIFYAMNLYTTVGYGMLRTFVYLKDTLKVLYICV